MTHYYTNLIQCISLCFIASSNCCRCRTLPSSLFIDDVQIYDVPQGKRRTVTCAQRRNLDEPLFAGTVVTKLSKNYLETVTFVPLDEAFKRQKRRARKARGTKRNKLTRRVQKTAKKIRTCKKGLRATAAVMGNFSCSFAHSFDSCERDDTCFSDTQGGIIGSGGTLREAYENALSECLIETNLRSELDAKVITPVSGGYTVSVGGNGCVFSSDCGIDPVGTAWNTYRCSAVGAFKRCPKGQPLSSSCEENFLTSIAQEQVRNAAMDQAVRRCETHEFETKAEAAAFDGLEAFKSKECLPYDCSRFISYVEPLTLTQ